MERCNKTQDIDIHIIRILHYLEYLQPGEMVVGQSRPFRAKGWDAAYIIPS